MSHLSLSFSCLRLVRSRAVVRRAWWGLLALAVGFAGTAPLAGAPPKNPEFCAPGATLTPEQAARIAAMILKEPASTQRMAALLDKIRHESDPLRNPFRSTEQVELLLKKMTVTTDPQQLFDLKWQYAHHLLQSSRPAEALKINEEIERMMKAQNAGLDVNSISELMIFRATCYLRIGEQENCLNNHNADSCLFPISGGGIHRQKDGSRGAVEVLIQLLNKFPGDLRARWLLNIAYMTLGEYPAKVPARWLIEPKFFASDYDIKRFPDVAGSVGLDLDTLAGGVVLEDFDHDGFLDLMISAWGLGDQLRLFHNNGDGTFDERTEEAGLVGEVGGLNLIQCDYNNDGWMDVFVLRGAWLATEGHYPASLLRNNGGDGTFTDVTEEAGLLRFHPTQTAVWLDYNGDGWIDLFIGNESVGPDSNPCELFRNNGDGTFTECAAQHGLAFVGFVKGAASGDYNNDGRPDLLLSRRDGPPVLWRNDGPAGADRSARTTWHFTNVSAAVGITEPLASFPSWFWDYDNDGLLDIMVTGYAVQDIGDIAADYMGLPHAGQRARLFHNNGDGTFKDVSRETGVNKVMQAMSANFGDLDNDGWLDFYTGTGDTSLITLLPNRMFRNNGGRGFQEVTASGGFGQLQKGHGIAFGDINNDGAQDIYSVVGGAAEADHYTNQLFANPGHGNNWLKLKLEGVQSNRAALGARIKVVVQAAEGERAIYRTVGSGATFGASPLMQEIGQGQARTITRVEIFWPVTGVTQTVTGLEINQLYQIREGTAAPVKIALKSFKWPATTVSAKASFLEGIQATKPGFFSFNVGLGLQANGDLDRQLQEIRKRYSLQQSDSGLLYAFKVSGTGLRPAPNDTVVVSVICVAANGSTKLPQLSAERSRVKMADLMPGLREGLQMMTLESRVVLLLPPALSFGDGEWPQGVERGAPLIFLVVLHDVISPQAAP